MSLMALFVVVGMLSTMLLGLLGVAVGTVAHRIMLEHQRRSARTRDNLDVQDETNTAERPPVLAAASGTDLFYEPSGPCCEAEPQEVILDIGGDSG